jgi:signal transduction histidine kinase/CheY-like chemotaxis protein
VRQLIPGVSAPWAHLLAIGAPLLLAGLIHQGQQAGWYNDSFGLLVMSLASMISAFGLLKRGAVILNQVNHNLQAAEAEIQRLKQELVCVATITEVTALKQAEISLRQKEQQLQQQAIQLQNQNRLKDEFLSALSHELRTPLHPILGWITLIRKQKLTPAKTTEALQIIECNVRQQMALVDDLLDVSSIIQGKLKLNFQRIDLAAVLNAAIGTVYFAAQAKRITIELQGLSSLQTIGDPDRLQQVFWNLLSNAIKFTPDNGQVKVELSLVHNSNAAHSAQIKVSDTGIGIASDFLEHVFDRFLQGDSSTTRKYRGLGLGLALVRHLVELHGGTVTVESPGVGLGSTFTVRLPLQVKAEPLTFIGAGTPVCGANNSLCEASFESQTMQTASAKTIKLRGARILLVDDDPDNLDLLRFFLEQEGAVVIAVTSPLEALELVAKNPPSLIISDIGMPEMNGYELIRQIRILPQTRQTPALAMTAFVQPEDQQLALIAGFQAHIAKPFHLEEFLASIIQLVQKESYPISL